MVPNNLYVSEYPMIYGNNMGNSNNSIPLHGYNNNLINNYQVLHFQQQNNSAPQKQMPPGNFHPDMMKNNYMYPPDLINKNIVYSNQGQLSRGFPTPDMTNSFNFDKYA